MPQESPQKLIARWRLQPLIRCAGYLCFAVAFLLIPISAHAAHVRLPLGGYCRPGRYFPIEISQSDAPILFSADGALPLETPAVSGRLIAPMLQLAGPGELRWVGGSLQLQTPGDRERLVALTTDIQSSDVQAGDLFPGDRILSIHLDSADPLPGPTAAWEALDAIVLGADAMSRITTAQRSALLAGGVMLAVNQKPDDRWPWKQRGNWWVLAYSPRGLIDQSISADAYSLTYAWLPQWSAGFRREVMVIATLLCITSIAISLFRNRGATIALIALALFTSAGIAIWQASLGTVDRAGGDVIVASQGVIQRDAWVFDRARFSADQNVEWAGSTHPIFASGAAITDTGMKLLASANGNPRFEFKLQQGKTIAFVRREVMLGSSPPVINTRQSPMRESAKAIYLSAADRILGETAESEGRWPGVVIGAGDR